MGNSIRFFCAGVPQTAGSKRAFVITPKGGGEPRAIITDTNKKGRPWRADVREAAADASRQPLFGTENPSVPTIFAEVPLKLSVTFYLPRPKAHYRSNGQLKDSAGAFCPKRPDATKLLRAIEDALNSVLWMDDAQIVVQHVEKRYADHEHAPGADICVEEVPVESPKVNAVPKQVGTCYEPNEKNFSVVQ